MIKYGSSGGDDKTEEVGDDVDSKRCEWHR